MKISQEVRDYAAAQEQAAAQAQAATPTTAAQPIDITQPINMLQSGMEKMSAEFRSRGSELYHRPANLSAEANNEPT